MSESNNLDSSIFLPEAKADSLDEQMQADSFDDESVTKKSKKEAAIIVDVYDTAEMIPYKPLDYHWFCTTTVQERTTWTPFSDKDSKKLERVYCENRLASFCC